MNLVIFEKKNKSKLLKSVSYLQGLHGGEIPAVVIRSENYILLGDPGDGLVSVAVETLNLMRTEQALLTHQRHLAEALPSLVQLLRR